MYNSNFYVVVKKNMLEEIAHRIWAGDWPITRLFSCFPNWLLFAFHLLPRTFRITWNTTSSPGPSFCFLRYFTFFHTHLKTIFLISFPQFWTMLLQLLFHCFLFSLIPLAYNLVHWCSVKLLFIVPRWTDFWLEKNKCSYMHSIHPFTGRPAEHQILAMSHFPNSTNKQAAFHS